MLKETVVTQRCIIDEALRSSLKDLELNKFFAFASPEVSELPLAGGICVPQHAAVQFPQLDRGKIKRDPGSCTFVDVLIPDFILTVETMNLRTKHCKYMYVYICALNPHLPILRDRPRLPL